MYKRSKNLFTLSHFDTCKHKIFMGSGCFAMILIILWSLVFQCNKHNSYWCIWQYQDKQTALGGHCMDRETNLARACLGHIRFPAHTTTLGQSVYPDIALYISNYYMFISYSYSIGVNMVTCHFVFSGIETYQSITWYCRAIPYIGRSN